MKIVFFRNKEMEDYYLIFNGKHGVNPEQRKRLFNNEGEYEKSGYPKVNVEVAYILTNNFGQEFFDYLEVVATNIIKHPDYYGEYFKAWLEFKNYEPEKWIKDFEKYKLEKYELNKNLSYIPISIQSSLF